MSDTDFYPVKPAAVDWIDGTPVGRDFDDPYFSREGGLEESRHVFLRGNDLRERFAELPKGSRFVIGETGFGSGLNFLAAARTFLKHASPASCLHFLSVEKHPLTRGQLEQALQTWPELEAIGAPLLRDYPPPTPGFHRRRFAGGRIVLTLLFGDALAMLRLARARVDAWFLDGFAPSRNPDMWQQSLFDELARLSAPGATLATFTAAGFVRRGLEASGFTMSKRAGFGRKRDMLTGVLGREQWRPAPCGGGSALIAGAGLAGATTARALAERGWRVRVLDPVGVAGMASGNLAGVVYTTPSAHPTPQNRFYQSSYLQALHWMRRLGFPRDDHDGRLNGVEQLPRGERDRRKTSEALTSGLWPPELLTPVDDHIRLTGGGHLSPPRWCTFLLDHPDIEVIRATVLDFMPEAGGWQVQSDNGEFRADALVLATALDTTGFRQLHWLPLKRIRGQVSYCAATPESSRWTHAWCHQGYLTPAMDGMHCVGATFNLHDDEPAARDEDDRDNLAGLRRNLPKQWQELGGDDIRVVDRRVGFRCQSTDFLPLCGEAVTEDQRLRTGLFLNIAHGSRGITGTPLCAEVIAALVTGEPCPVDTDLLDALAPERFIVRQRRKKGDPVS